jgi:hypothetical protein
MLRVSLFVSPTANTNFQAQVAAFNCSPQRMQAVITLSHMSDTQTHVSLANHMLITFDAPNYADEDAKRHGQKKSVEEWVLISGASGST